MTGQADGPPYTRAAIQPPAGTLTRPETVCVPALAGPAVDQTGTPVTRTSRRWNGVADATVRSHAASDPASLRRTSPGCDPWTLKFNSGPVVTKLRPPRDAVRYVLKLNRPSGRA